MALVPIDNYPQLEGSGIARNSTVWVQFNKTLKEDTVSYITVSVTSPSDGYIPLEGEIELKASANGMADSMIKYTPDPAFDAYKRYVLSITGGENGIEAYDGDKLTNSLEYFFTIGSGTVTNPDVPATGVPAASSYIPDTPLAVLSTNPEQNATNIDLDVQYIKIEFNDIIPSGINLYDLVKLTSKEVL